jgi:hypothetical protein
MTKIALLHIGTAKTGSTSIQRWLANAQRGGSLGTVCYPLWRSNYNHQRLVTLYKPYEELPSPMRQSYGPCGRPYKHMRDTYREFLFRELRDASAAIISGESLCSVFSPPNAARLREDLESLGFQKFHVVLYVRDPADYFLSNMQQALKMTYELPFVRDPSTFIYEFLRYTETWEKVFPGKLIVRKFPTDPCHDVIDDFADVLQQCLNISLPRVPLRMNSSHSTEAMQIIQDYRETFWPDTEILTPDTARLIEFLSWSRQEMPQTRPVLKKEIAEQIRANHKADAKELYDRYGVDLGLGNCNSKAVSPRDEPHRVSEIVDSFDSDIAYRLLLRLARYEITRKPKTLPWRIAARIYRSIPITLLPASLDAWLRKRYQSEVQIGWQ